MKFEKITPQNIRSLEAEIKAALVVLSEATGMEFTLGKGKYTTDDIDIQIKGVVSGGVPAEVKQMEVEAKYLGLDMDKVHDGYKLHSYRSSARKKKFVLLNLKTGRLAVADRQYVMKHHAKVVPGGAELKSPPKNVVAFPKGKANG